LLYVRSFGHSAGIGVTDGKTDSLRQTGGHIRHNNIVPCMHCMLTRIKKLNYCLIAAVYLKG